jgi:hypothetical protein
MTGAFLDWALETFSGYVAADELYEGPYCVPSVVNHGLHFPQLGLTQRVVLLLQRLLRC